MTTLTPPPMYYSHYDKYDTVADKAPILTSRAKVPVMSNAIPNGPNNFAFVPTPLVDPATPS